jgi:hypothetical protein
LQAGNRGSTPRISTSSRPSSNGKTRVCQSRNRVSTTLGRSSLSARSSTAESRRLISVRFRFDPGRAYHCAGRPRVHSGSYPGRGRGSTDTRNHLPRWCSWPARLFEAQEVPVRCGASAPCVACSLGTALGFQPRDGGFDSPATLQFIPTGPSRRGSETVNLDARGSNPRVGAICGRAQGATPSPKRRRWVRYLPPVPFVPRAS